MALDTPDVVLKAQVGGDVVAIVPQISRNFAEKITKRFGCEPALVDGSLRIERPRGHEFVREVVDAFPGEVQSITFGRPTLEDVFIHQILDIGSGKPKPMRSTQHERFSSPCNDIVET